MTIVMGKFDEPVTRLKIEKSVHILMLTQQPTKISILSSGLQLTRQYKARVKKNVQQSDPKTSAQDSRNRHKFLTTLIALQSTMTTDTPKEACHREINLTV